MATKDDGWHELARIIPLDDADRTVRKQEPARDENGKPRKADRELTGREAKIVYTNDDGEKREDPVPAKVVNKLRQLIESGEMSHDEAVAMSTEELLALGGGK